MKCPKCRREIALEAIECKWCSWRAVTRGGDVRVDADGVVTTRRLPRKEVEVYLAKMRAIVGGHKKR